ncbi:STAS domain-containing protein [Streptomyces sp. NPDC059785]|uniref:STAS domain-containing protein n=1 Tax=Streptomyces sp. NPDC059785 TaxID=3346945 RepID=UPI00365C3531
MSSAPSTGLLIVDAMTPAVLALPGLVTRDDGPRLGEQVRALLETTATGVVIVDVAGLGPPGLGPPGLVTVDVLARMQLAAKRAGGRIRLRNADPALRALLVLVGLGVDVGRQPEEREPPGGVEEAVQSGDPSL